MHFSSPSSYAFVEVRGATLYGIQLLQSDEYSLYNKRLKCSPQFVYFDNFNKVLIDYNECLQDSDFEELSLFFGGLTAGYTFTISGADYLDEAEIIDSNLGGTYTFDSYVNNIVIANVVTIEDIDNQITKYNRDYFLQPPQFNRIAGLSGTTYNVIKNVLGRELLNNLGLYYGDFVSIDGSTLNPGYIGVSYVKTLDNGEELLFLTDSVVNESYIGEQLQFKVFMRGVNDLSKSSDATETGSSKLYDSEGTFLECFENQTELQSYLRQFKYPAAYTEDVFSVGGSCDTGSALATNVVLGTNFDQIYKISVSGIGIIYANNLTNFPTLRRNIIYKFDTSHSSNYGYSLVFESLTLDTTEQALINSNTSYYGVPGKNGSFVILNVTSTFPDKITVRHSTDAVASRKTINITN